MEAAICPRVRVWMAAFGCAVAALLVISPAAKAGIVTDGVPTDGGCPSIADKPGAVPHVDYQGMQHITYCYGPIDIHPGQNVIRLNEAKDPGGSQAVASVPGYITRFDPEFVYEDGSVPGVDVLHLHHAVWAVNGAPTFAAGEEKTITQLPQGFGYRSMPTDTWFLNDMLHDLVAQPAKVYLVWRIDFVPDTRTRRGGDEDGAQPVDGRRREPELLSRLRRAAEVRAERHLHVPRSGAAVGSPAVQRHRRPAGVAEGRPRLYRCRPELDPQPRRHPDRHRGAPAPRRPQHAAARQTRRPDQHSLHLRRPLLRAGGRGVLGRRDGGDTADLARGSEGGRHAERARDL